jgi:hypothetical protein
MNLVSQCRTRHHSPLAIRREPLTAASTSALFTALIPASMTIIANVALAVLPSERTDEGETTLLGVDLALGVVVRAFLFEDGESL